MYLKEIGLVFLEKHILSIKNQETWHFLSSSQDGSIGAQSFSENKLNHNQNMNSFLDYPHLKCI